MMGEAPHPLDRPVWSCLSGRQAALALVDGGARRMRTDYGLFASTEDEAPDTLRALSRLIAAHGEAYLVEPRPAPDVPGAQVLSRALCRQMLATGPVATVPAPFDVVPLDEADAPEMLALATLARPGPFFRRTHELGDFIGVKVDGRLVSMAGERMRMDGFTEVSGVCTHPDHRSRGYGAALLTQVARAIEARGELPFLHVYAHNRGAIDLYRQLGFEFRQELVMTVLAPIS